MTVTEVLLLISNFCAFCLMGADKLRAGREEWRISEKVLFLFPLLGGGLGGLMGMVVFHHKVSKPRFRYGMPALLLAEIGLAAVLIKVRPFG